MAPTPYTFVYKQVGDVTLSLDFYPPKQPAADGTDGDPEQRHEAVPLLVYFHGGGLTVGDRTSWFPEWLYERATASGIAFVSADYSLIPPSTAHDILADIHALFAYLSTALNPALRVAPQVHSEVHPQLNVRVDAARIAVAGTSAGAYCAYLAATHASPRPKAVLSLYGLGGALLTQHYVRPKTAPFFRGRPLLDASDAAFAGWLFPASAAQMPAGGAPLVYSPPEEGAPGTSGTRMLLARLYLQQGSFLDYLTGLHAPSLSAALRLDADSVPAGARALFPELHVSRAWPPAFLIHGGADTAVLPAESRALAAALRGAGVEVVLREVEGAEHSFDYCMGAGEYGVLWDEAAGFVRRAVGG